MVRLALALISTYTEIKRGHFFSTQFYELENEDDG